MKRIIEKLACVAAISLSASNISYAQDNGLNAIAESFQPEYLPRHLLIFVEELDLDETQNLIVESLLDKYQEDFNSGRERLEEKIQSLSKELDAGSALNKGEEAQRAIMRKVLKPIFDWAQERKDLGNEFLSDISFLLTRKNQQELWPNCIQRIYRELKMPAGVFSMERLDLFKCVRDSGLSPQAQKKAKISLNKYGPELHEALTKRQSILEISPEAALNSMLKDMKAPLINPDELSRSRIAIRDINRNFIEAIASSINSQEGNNFKDEAYLKAYPRIFRDTPAERFIESTLRLESIDEATKQLIREIENRYLIDLSILNDKLISKTEEKEQEEQIIRERNKESRKKGEPVERVPNLTKDLFVERRERGKKAVDEIKALLGQEAFDDLPGASRWSPINRSSSNPDQGMKPTIVNSNKPKGENKKDSKSKKGNNNPKTKPYENEPNPESLSGSGKKGSSKR